MVTFGTGFSVITDSIIYLIFRVHLLISPSVHLFTHSFIYLFIHELTPFCFGLPCIMIILQALSGSAVCCREACCCSTPVHSLTHSIPSHQCHCPSLTPIYSSPLHLLTPLPSSHLHSHLHSPPPLHSHLHSIATDPRTSSSPRTGARSKGRCQGRELARRRQRSTCEPANLRTSETREGEHRTVCTCGAPPSLTPPGTNISLLLGNREIRRRK